MRSSGWSGKQPYPLSYSPITTRDDPRLPEIAARSRAALLALRARAGPAAVDQQRVGFWVVADDAREHLVEQPAERWWLVLGVNWPTTRFGTRTATLSSPHEPSAT